ncbi:thiol reductase thioredoxin [Muricauda sp. JGD-17]|uniref:Thiol reductase thioredoxin n=1 Tax=Flagellimonas ochracea TaxID=2696472 RepID=A0A964TDP5_9FLAO|nr:thioredoxin family protein [Allomuricauda ochracea]NAY92241.1 thiol reductase thioredoxin [Allomuricauda ochracea]
MKHILTPAFVLCTLFMFSQEFNKEIVQEDGRKFLVGQINLEGLKAEPYAAWFHGGWDSYEVDASLVKLFQRKLAKYDIKLFLGVWCGDSKRETPRFLKILEEANYPMEQLEIVALDRRKEHYKKSPTGKEKGLNIIKVPTMVFFKNGRETNRIVESPIESLEEDMAQIVHNKPYTPNYAQ